MFHAIWEFAQSADCTMQSENPQIGSQSADCYAICRLVTWIYSLHTGWTITTDSRTKSTMSKEQMSRLTYIQPEQVNSCLLLKTVLGMSSHCAWYHSWHVRHKAVFLMRSSGCQQEQNTGTFLVCSTSSFADGIFSPGNGVRDFAVRHAFRCARI